MAGTYPGFCSLKQPDSYPVAIYESGGKGEKIGFY